MSYGEDDWFQYTNEFNRPADSPGAAGNYNFEPGNIDNIPLSDDPPLSPGQALEFDLAAPIDDYQYDPLRLSPNGGLNGQHQQPGTSGSNDIGGQFQSMHVMQNTDSFDQHMQPSTSIEYNSFEMPTVINAHMDNGSYQDLGIDDPNSYYASQQPSTSQGNDMVVNESYDMIVQSTSYIPQMDHVNPSSVGNPPSHTGISQQNDNNIQVPQQAPKSKAKKRAPPKKKPPAAASDSVGSVLTKANKIGQQMANSHQLENNNENQVQMEVNFSPEDALVIIGLKNELERLQVENNNGFDRTEEINKVQARIIKLFSNNSSAKDEAELKIVNQIKSMENSSSSQPAKKAPPKKKPTNQKNSQQLQNQQPPSLSHPQVQMTPAKIIMDPPTTTMVPSNGQTTHNYNEGVNEEYLVYQHMDDQGASNQQYDDFHQPGAHEPLHHSHNQRHQQVIQAKVVPTMTQRTHEYRQEAVFSSQNTNGPGPSPQLHQPQSHESHHMDQMQEQQYHPQEHPRPRSRQVFTHVHHSQDAHLYQGQDIEPTLGDVVRQTQGRYQGPQDAPQLRQQLITNVNASTSKQIIQRSRAPTPSPGNFQNNNMQQPQYSETFHQQSSYPSSHDMQPHSQSQHGYDNSNQFESMDEFYDVNQGRSQETQIVRIRTDSHQPYEQQEMYIPIEDQDQLIEPDVYYPEVPECTVEESKEKLEQRLEEKRLIRVGEVKKVLMEQLNQLECPIDVTPFRGRMDILERFLPFHHLAVGEEPVSNFDETYEKIMTKAINRTNAIGSRIRNIALRDTMRSSTEWEENMILFLETESERRKLEEDRRLASHDPHTFLQNSDVIRNVRNRRLNLERTRQAAPPVPEHLKELKDGELSAVYSEYEFDSYDENRPRASPLPFISEEPEFESESEPESEEENGAGAQPIRNDVSPLVGFPQLSPAPSPSRGRNESESTFDWKDEDESPLLSPEGKYNKVADQLACEIFGTQEDLDKSEPFPFKQISEAARKQHELLQQPKVAESTGSSVDSSSTDESTPRRFVQPKPKSPSPKPSTSETATEKQRRSPSPFKAAVVVSTPVNVSSRYNNEGSPEIGDDYSMSPSSPQVIAETTSNSVPAEDIPPIPLPVPIHMIKLEKEDAAQTLKLRVPISIFQKGLKMATNEDDEIQEIPIAQKEPLKLRLNFKTVKTEEPSPDRVLASHSSRKTPAATSSTSSPNKNVAPSAVPPAKMDLQTSVKTIIPSSMSSTDPVSKPAEISSSKTPIFKTPLQTPPKRTTDAKKRRSDKIEDTPQQNKRSKDLPSTSSFVTPKSGGSSGSETPQMERFLRTMTDGRKIVMKIGKIPNNINHFVTPRRDKKGNLHKDLSPTKDTRLKMRFFKRNGELAVEVTEHFPESAKNEEGKDNQSDLPTTNGPCSSYSLSSTVSSSVPTKGRPAPASRKSSIDIAGKDKKATVQKSKSTYSNRFNPFANALLSSKPSTVSVNPTSTSGSLPPVSVNSPKMMPPVKPKTGAPRTSSTPTNAPNRTTIQKTVPQVVASKSLIRTTPIIPKITVTNVTPVQEKLLESQKVIEKDNSISSLLPWMFNTDGNSDQKQKPIKTHSTPTLDASIITSKNKDFLKVKTEHPEEVAASTTQESPRASSSLSMSFFEDDKANGFPFLRSPKRTNEPLPVVEFSDDEEDDLAHSTFSHATDHLLGTSKMNKPVNGAAPFLPWSTDP